jgi:arachidonate 5-lipoxygenase
MKTAAKRSLHARFSNLKARLVTDRVGQTPDRRRHILPDRAPSFVHRRVDKLALKGLTATVVGMLTANSLSTRERMSHENGLCGQGRIRVLDAPDIPAHEFFRPGRAFRGRLRHSSVSFMDDASMVVRSASLKFADTAYATPLDIEMNTGEISLFSTAWQFGQFMVSTIRGRGSAFAEYFERNPHGRDASHLGVRRNPSSFAVQRYYSQAVYRFVALDGTRYACRYRLVPATDEPETGIPVDDDLDCVWVQAPTPGEPLSPNYLKDEYRTRVLAQPVSYRLQIQLMPLADVQSDEAFNASAVWDPDRYRWRPLAEVTVDRVMPRAPGNQVRFSIGHQPPGLGLFRSVSPFDYHSLNHLRAATSTVKRARVLSYVVRGMPDPIGEERAWHDPNKVGPSA